MSDSENNQADVSGQKCAKLPLYMRGTFDRELNYKMWSTYKGRFNASLRLQRKHDLSTRTIALLSSYVAVFSVITAFLGDSLGDREADVLLVVGVSLSIVILVISMLEASQGYNLRAFRFHQSGLDIAELYKELRAIKSKHDKKDQSFFSEVDKILHSYNDILQRSENHEDIDHDCFRASKPDYDDHSLSSEEVTRIKRRLFLTQYSVYYVAMITPIIVFILILVLIGAGASDLGKEKELNEKVETEGSAASELPASDERLQEQGC